MKKLTNLYKPYMLLSIKKKLMLILAVLTCFNVSISAATIEPLWECEAHGVTGSDVVRSSIGFGDKIYVSNVTTGCVEEWHKGNKTKEWNVNQFLSSQNENTTLWTAITCDDFGNILVNIGGKEDVAGGTKWLLIPADGSQMQIVEINYPSKVTPGRIDNIGRVIGNLLDDAYAVFAPSENPDNIFDLFGPNQSNNVVLINLRKDTNGQVVSDLNKSRIIPSKTACSIGINVVMNTTYREISSLSSVKDVGSKIYLRNYKNSNLFMWNGSHLTEQKGIGNDGCTARGFDVFTIKDVDYYVVPCKSSDGRTASFEVRYLNTGDVAAQYSTNGTEDSEYSSYTARVSSDGKSAVIYAFNYKDKIGVYTFKPDGYVELIQDLSIDSDTTLKVGETAVLNAMITPSNATNKMLSWVSMDESIATVDNNGMISAIAPGNTKIIATTTDGTELSDTCAVTVIQLVQDLKIDTDTTLNVGETAVLKATITPENATNKTLIWASNNIAVAIVSNGVVTAKSSGTATITATTTDGTILSDTCVVTVNQPIIEQLWVHDMSSIGSAVRRIACVSGSEVAATNISFSGGADNVIFFNAGGQTSKTHDVAKFLNDNKIGTTNDSIGFSPYGLGCGIDVDGVGNIVVNLGFPSVTSATNFVAIAPDGTMKHIVCDVLQGEAARADFLGVTGDIFTNGYIGLTPNRTNCVIVHNIYEGEQDTDYSYNVDADESTTFTNETKVLWAKKTVSDDDAFAPEFYVYQRSLTGLRYSDGSSALTIMEGDNFSQGKATNSGATAFVVNGITYIVMPTPDESGSRANAFKIVNVATGEVALTCQGAEGFATNYAQDFSSYVNEDGTVSIAQLVQGKYLAMYVFDPSGNYEPEPEPTVAVESLTIDSEKTLSVGETATITATILPDNASNKSLSWTSLNTDVATVRNGAVTAVSEGTATIIATTTDGTNLSDTCVVTVNQVIQSILTTVWEASASAYTTAEARDIAARGKQMIVPNKTNSTIEIWENGAIVSEYNLTEFLDSIGVTSIGLGISTDEAGNIVGNLNFPAMDSSLKYVVIPSVATDASTAKYIECTPVGTSWVDGTTGRMDYLGDHMAGNILENGYVVACANGMTEVMLLNIYEGEQDTDYSYAVTMDDDYVAFNVETSATFVAAMDPDGEKAPKFLVRNRSKNGIRECDGADVLTNTGVVWDNVATTSNYTAFTVGGETYVVINKEQDGVRSHAWAVYKLSDGTEVASWAMPTGEAVNYMTGFASSVNEDGTVNIFQYNPGIRFAMYVFDPSGANSSETVTNVSEKGKGSTAVETIEINDLEEVIEYYNLQGMRVENPEKGIYIKKQGSKATKVILK